MNVVTAKELLAEFFKEEATNPKTDALLDIGEEWFTATQKSMQELIGRVLEVPSESNDTKENNKLKNVDDSTFEQLFRMKQSTFAALQQELSCESQDELLLCLWMLGNTEGFNEIAVIFHLNPEYVFEVCEKYCRNIVNLSSKYVTWPSFAEAVSIEQGFQSKFQFPSVLGVIGNLHISIHVPDNDPNVLEYLNRNTHQPTIVLQAVCDSNFLLRDVFVGYPGNNTTSAILKASPLYEKLTSPNDLLVTTTKHILGGTEHPQFNTLLTPYVIPKHRKPMKAELKFNALHASAMETIEKTFNMLENRFQRLNSLDMATPKFAALAAGAICTLHNFCRIRNDYICC